MFSNTEYQPFFSLPLTGGIIWRISDFEAKMTDARENNTVLCSPVFYSSQYGYKLRVNFCVVYMWCRLENKIVEEEWCVLGCDTV